MMPNYERLSTLAKHGREAHDRFSALESRDDMSHLPKIRQDAWKRVLSSTASTEATEDVIIQPLIEAFAHDAEISDYLQTHAQDELRHHMILTRYMKGTFNYVRQSRSLSSKILYDTLLPKITATFTRKPLYGLALIYCYEKFSVYFYDVIRKTAQKDGAVELLNILKTIEKDELRHMAGMESLIKSTIAKQGGLKTLDRIGVGAVLGLVVMDANFGPMAIHNKDLRQKLLTLGFDTQALTQAARDAVKHTMKVVSYA